MPLSHSADSMLSVFSRCIYRIPAAWGALPWRLCWVGRLLYASWVSQGDATRRQALLLVSRIIASSSHHCIIICCAPDQATVMVVSVTASTTSGQPLSEESLKKVLGACEAALQLDQDKVWASLHFAPASRLNLCLGRGCFPKGKRCGQAATLYGGVHLGSDACACRWRCWNIMVIGGGGGWAVFVICRGPNACLADQRLSHLCLEMRAVVSG